MTGAELPSPHTPTRLGQGGLALGVLGLGLALAFGAPRLSLGSSGRRVTGTVVDLVRQSRGAAKPIVEFEAAPGVKARTIGIGSSRPPAFHVGERVGVVFDPADPSRAAIDTFEELWLGPLLLVGLALAGLGGGALGIGIGIARRRRRERVRAEGRRLEAAITEVEEVRENKSYRFFSTVTLASPGPDDPASLLVDLGFRPTVGRRAAVFVDRLSRDYFVELLE